MCAPLDDVALARCWLTNDNKNIEQNKINSNQHSTLPFVTKPVLLNNTSITLISRIYLIYYDLVHSQMLDKENNLLINM